MAAVTRSAAHPPHHYPPPPRPVPDAARAGRPAQLPPARPSPALRGNLSAPPHRPGCGREAGSPSPRPARQPFPGDRFPRHPRGAGGGVPQPPGSARSPAPNRLPAAGGPGAAGLPRCPSRSAGEERGGFGSALISLPGHCRFGSWHFFVETSHPPPGIC
ncbi:uncharacterized protein [Haliaeetus albicilla]|uniref:uncharacterized protein n=1 Tax=Haliaeetus albicilla TaxID=8969 RepID=UPI0037E8D29E